MLGVDVVYHVAMNSVYYHQLEHNLPGFVVVVVVVLVVLALGNRYYHTP